MCVCVCVCVVFFLSVFFCCVFPIVTCVDLSPSPRLPRYHVQCDPGQLLHFLISSFSTEKRYGSMCLDSVTVDRSAYGAKKTICGGLANLGTDIEDFNDGQLYVDFTTNRVVQDSGFYIAITCVRPQFFNQPSSFVTQPRQFGLREKRELGTVMPPPPPPPFFPPLAFSGNPPYVGCV